MITLIGGPADQVSVPSNRVSGNEVRVMIDASPRSPLSFRSGPINYKQRIIREPLLTEALGNATDAEILKLMEDLSKTKTSGSR